MCGAARRRGSLCRCPGDDQLHRCHGPGGAALFNGQPRGIGGDPIRSASVAQVRRFADLTRQRGHSTKIIGVGGISTAAHVQEYLEAGAEAVQLATAPMVNPLVGVQIRSEFAKPKFQPGLKP